MEAFKGSAWRTVYTADAYVSGAWRTLQYGEAYVGGAWRLIVSFAQPLDMAVSPHGGFWDGATATVTAGPCTATPTGGVAPFTYAWVKLSGDDITITAPTAATTSFNASGMANGEDRSATFRCTVTDTLGTTKADDITITVARSAGTGGS